MTELFNDAAEQNLLGCLLTRNDIYPRIADITKPEHFFREAHAVIFTAIKTKIEAGEPVSPIMLKHLESNPYVSAAGGVQYLVSLCANVVTAYSAPGYAKTIKEYYVRRTVKALTDEYAFRSETDNDPEKLLNNLERDLFLLRENEVDAKILTVEDGVNEVLDWIVDIQAGYIKPIKSGLGTLDSIISGFYPGRLYVVAGRPGMGKTVFALNVAEYASRNNQVLYFSLEMTRKEMTMRLLSRHTKISVQRQFEAGVTPQQIGQLRTTLDNKNLIIDDRSGLTINQMGNYAKRVQKARGLDMIVIDYLGLIRGDNPNIVQRIAEITVECKRMAKELGVPVILLSQLNRGLEERENKRPMLSDLRDSGAIEQDADVVLMLYREEYYFENGQTKQEGYGGKRIKDRPPLLLEDIQGKAEIIIAKNRQGENKTAHVGFNGAGQFFYDGSL